MTTTSTRLRAPLQAAGLAAAMLCAGCRYEPLGWWDITELTATVEGQEPVQTDDVGFIQVVDGGQIDALFRVELVATAEGTVALVATEGVATTTGSWEMDGKEDFVASIFFGTNQIVLYTDDTTGGSLTLRTDAPADVRDSANPAAAGVAADLSLALER
jgi:hypothetical protein